jgi:WD40 repeat protein
MGGLNCFDIDHEDQHKVITVGQERKITFWDLQKTNSDKVVESSPFNGETDELFSVALSSDNKIVATGGSLGIVRIWEYPSMKFLTECKGHSNDITCLKFSPDNKQLISTGNDGLILVWNIFL